MIRVDTRASDANLAGGVWLVRAAVLVENGDLETGAYADRSGLSLARRQGVRRDPAALAGPVCVLQGQAEAGFKPAHGFVRDRGARRKKCAQRGGEYTALLHKQLDERGRQSAPRRFRSGDDAGEVRDGWRAPVQSAASRDESAEHRNQDRGAVKRGQQVQTAVLRGHIDDSPGPKSTVANHVLGERNRIGLSGTSRRHKDGGEFSIAGEAGGRFSGGAPSSQNERTCAALGGRLDFEHRNSRRSRPLRRGDNGRDFRVPDRGVEFARGQSRIQRNTDTPGHDGSQSHRPLGPRRQRQRDPVATAKAETIEAVDSVLDLVKKGGVRESFPVQRLYSRSLRRFSGPLREQRVNRQRLVRTRVSIHLTQLACLVQLSSRGSRETVSIPLSRERLVRIQSPQVLPSRITGPSGVTTTSQFTMETGGITSAA